MTEGFLAHFRSNQGRQAWWETRLERIPAFHPYVTCQLTLGAASLSLRRKYQQSPPSVAVTQRGWLTSALERKIQDPGSPRTQEQKPSGAGCCNIASEVRGCSGGRSGSVVQKTATYYLGQFGNACRTLKDTVYNPISVEALSEGPFIILTMLVMSPFTRYLQSHQQ